MVHFNINHVYTYMFQAQSRYFRIPKQNHVYMYFSPLRATCPTHLIVFDLVTIIW